MVKKQKKKKENTKDNSSFDLDNEIIIGITPLEEKKPSKGKKSTTNAKNRKTKSSSTNKKINNNSVDKKVKNKKQKVADKKQNGNTRNLQNKNYRTRKNEKVKSKLKRHKVNNINRNNAENEEKIPEELAIEIQGIKIQDEKSQKNRKNKKNSKNNSNKKNKKINDKTKSNKKINPTFRIVKWTSLVAIIIAGGIYFMLSPFFNIKEIDVQGIDRLTREEIISLSRIELNENTFKLQTNEVQQLIKQNAYIDKVIVKRKFPDKIEIKVTERKPTYMILFGNAYIYINNQGYLLEVANTPLKIPAITGFLTPENEIHEGNRLCSEDLQRLDQVLQIMKSAESNGIKELITKINIEDKQDYILELNSEKKIVHIGDNTNLSTKMLYVVSILNENKNVEGEIFVNTDLNNKGAIFRKKI